MLYFQEKLILSLPIIQNISYFCAYFVRETIFFEHFENINVIFVGIRKSGDKLVAEF